MAQIPLFSHCETTSLLPLTPNSDIAEVMQLTSPEQVLGVRVKEYQQQADEVTEAEHVKNFITRWSEIDADVARGFKSELIQDNFSLPT